MKTSISFDDVLQAALQYVGYPAVKHYTIRDDAFHKGNNPKGFDCSGLWQYILAEKLGADIFEPKLGRNIRYAREFFDYFGTFVSLGSHLKGDLAFFSSRGVMPGHMGLYIGDGMIIHKGFVDVSLSPVEPTGDYPKRIIVSRLDVISEDRRTAGNPIFHKPEWGEQRYFANPIGFKRFIF